MVGELVPSPVDPVDAGGEFWQRYHEFRRVRQKETRPDEPVRDDADEEARMKRISPFQGDDRYEVSRDGEMLGLLHAYYTKPESPEYESNKHLYDADLFVRGANRRRGIGSSFLPVLIDLMERRNCTTVSFWVEEDAGHGFLKWVGAEVKLNEIESRLIFSEIDWPELERWVEQGARRSPQTRLEIIDGPVPEEEREAFSAQMSVMLNTVPMEALDHGDNHVDVGDTAVGDEDLLTVEDPAAVLAHGARLHRRHVRARLGLRDRECAQGGLLDSAEACRDPGRDLLRGPLREDGRDR